MQVEIFSDVVCPWCAVGKRRFEAALAKFAHRDDVQVTWRSFELDPDTPVGSNEDVTAHLAKKYGMTHEQTVATQAKLVATAALDGLAFNLEGSKRANTFDAHRLLHYAKEVGLQDALKERLFRAYFTDGALIDDHETLLSLATEVGLEADTVAAVLASDAYGKDVRADETEARMLGISGVPFYILDRHFAFSGAQPSDVILQALEEAWAKSNPLVMTGGEGVTCEGDNCAI